MKIKLIFHDWVKNGESIYNTQDGIELSLSDFHSGTVFHGEIHLDKEHQLRFFEAIKTGCYPAFYILPEEVIEDSI